MVVVVVVLFAFAVAVAVVVAVAVDVVVVAAAPPPHPLLLPSSIRSSEYNNVMLTPYGVNCCYLLAFF